MTRDFNLIIIGDEILHGSRQDKHFPYFKNLLETHGLRLNSVQYLPDERPQLAKQLERSFSDGLPAFVTGGIGATPDDHTRQAAAEAAKRPLQRHPEAAALIEAVTRKRGESTDSPEHRQRLHMADFPQGAQIIPNPYNGIAGFTLLHHHFLPGFPVMAHPMAEWVLHTHYAESFHRVPTDQRAILVYGLPESRITPLMEHIEHTYPGIRTYSLPSVGRTTPDGRHTHPHIEFGLKAEGEACTYIDTAWTHALDTLRRLGAQLHDTQEAV
ncbi:molybdopterin-binding protein [Neisseria bacilliformis]|jgi:molybdopterin-binding protein|uniref:competence/damage-inducible protein A n=1 Tax=Neisseria bacilliformis TaxID=267212 RepID=UPI000668978A|nr:molybdopterin-binding protein [Neisseria bacilliformis]